MYKCINEFLKNIYLFERQGNRQVNTDGELPSTESLPKCPQYLVGVKPDSKNSIQVFHMGGRNSTT